MCGILSSKWSRTKHTGCSWRNTSHLFACHTKGDVRNPSTLVMLLSVNIQTENGITALMFIVDTGYQEGVKILLNAGASANLRDSNGYVQFGDC